MLVVAASAVAILLCVAVLEVASSWEVVGCCQVVVVAWR